MTYLLKQNLTEVQARMKLYSDQHRTERNFEVGDEVYLKLQPYRQTSLALGKNMKLTAKYYGPYPVIQKIGAVAYILQLPTSSTIHLVFRVSLLKKKISSKHIPSNVLPTTDSHGVFNVYPLQV